MRPWTLIVWVVNSFSFPFTFIFRIIDQWRFPIFWLLSFWIIDLFWDIIPSFRFHIFRIIHHRIINPILRFGLVRILDFWRFKKIPISFKIAFLFAITINKYFVSI